MSACQIVGRAAQGRAYVALPVQQRAVEMQTFLLARCRPATERRAEPKYKNPHKPLPLCERAQLDFVSAVRHK